MSTKQYKQADRDFTHIPPLDLYQEHEHLKLLTEENAILKEQVTCLEKSNV